MPDPNLVPRPEPFPWLGGPWERGWQKILCDFQLYQQPWEREQRGGLSPEGNRQWNKADSATLRTLRGRHCSRSRTQPNFKGVVRSVSWLHDEMYLLTKAHVNIQWIRNHDNSDVQIRRRLARVWIRASHTSITSTAKFKSWRQREFVFFWPVSSPSSLR